MSRIDFSPRSQVASASAPIQRCCGQPGCKDEHCTNPAHYGLDLDTMMDETDATEEMQRAMQTSDARFQQQSKQFEQLPEHLQGQTKINRKDRRLAQIKSPSDRMALSSEQRPQNKLHYVWLKQSPGQGKEPIDIGRLQDPSNEKAPVTERHIFEKGTRGAPSYPKESTNLQNMGTSQNLSSPQLFGEVQKALDVEPLSVTGEKQQRNLMTTANIVGIAEQRRDPFMGFSSVQTIDFAQNPNSNLTPPEVFGKKSGKKNLPGVLPASGTGATGHFRGFRADLEQGKMPQDQHGKRIYTNIRRQHLALMREGYNPKTVRRLLEEGMSPDDIRLAMRARMRSAATRRAAYSTGQLPMRLRSLRNNKLDPKSNKIKKVIAENKEKRAKLVNKKRGLDL